MSKQIEITFYATVDDDFDMNLWWAEEEGNGNSQIIRIQNPSYREIGGENDTE